MFLASRGIFALDVPRKCATDSCDELRMAQLKEIPLPEAERSSVSPEAYRSDIMNRMLDDWRVSVHQRYFESMEA